MIQRNIHGDFTMTFENRLLNVESWGATNRELGLAWFDCMQKCVESSPEKYTTPWAALNDCRQWDIASLDSWETYNEVVSWMSDHNCVLLSFLVNRKIQEFAINNGYKDKSILKVYFDYDEAYQACLNKLAEANRK